LYKAEQDDTGEDMYYKSQGTETDTSVSNYRSANNRLPSGPPKTQTIKPELSAQSSTDTKANGRNGGEQVSSAPIKSSLLGS
jgi:hypothetical protein